MKILSSNILDRKLTRAEFVKVFFFLILGVIGVSSYVNSLKSLDPFTFKNRGSKDKVSGFGIGPYGGRKKHG